MGKEYSMNNPTVKPVWNSFQATMRILKRKQKQILADYRNRLTEQQISKVKKDMAS